MQYTWDRYRSICSVIKCPLEITADDYFVISNGAFYDAIQAAYIVLWLMRYLHVMPTKYHQFACYRLTTVVLFICLYVRAYN